MKKVLLLLAILMFGMTFAIDTPVAYDDYYYDGYYYDDDYSFDYGSSSGCCCTGFILPLGMLVAGLGYMYSKRE